MDLQGVAPSTPEVDDSLQVVVVDIPASTTTEEAERLLNEPYSRGFYIHRAADHGMGNLRVVFVHKDRPAATKPTATKEAVAIQFLRDNREMSIQQLVAAFKAIGFPRSAGWITEKRAEVIRAQSRI